jgi:hypothetical protein
MLRAGSLSRGMMMIDSEALYDLKLHEEALIRSPPMSVIRVPGGWIYTDMRMTGKVFVPLSTEFKPVKKVPINKRWL